MNEWRTFLHASIQEIPCGVKAGRRGQMTRGSAEHAENEMLKASTGVGYGAVSSRHPTRGSGECRELLSGVRGENDFSVYCRCQRAHSIL